MKEYKVKELVTLIESRNKVINVRTMFYYWYAQIPRLVLHGKERARRNSKQKLCNKVTYAKKIKILFVMVKNPIIQCHEGLSPQCHLHSTELSCSICQMAGHNVEEMYRNLGWKSYGDLLKV